MRTMTEETTRRGALKRGEIDLAYLFAGPSPRSCAGRGYQAGGAVLTGAFWLELPDSGIRSRRGTTAACAWPQPRPRRQAINQAETLGSHASRATSSAHLPVRDRDGTPL